MSGDHYLFLFELEHPIQWNAGQHGLFLFQGQRMRGGNFRPFSVASSADEKQILIGTRISQHPSVFKARLKAMEIGARTLTLRGPYGWFYIPHYEKKIALIAGGIGITAMRAILKDLETQPLPVEVTLFYVDTKKAFVFKEELKTIQRCNPKIKLIFLDDRANFQRELLEYVRINKNNSLYFLSGSPSMVQDLKNKLKREKIKRAHIKNHPFTRFPRKK